MKTKYSAYLVSGLSKTKDIDTEYVMNNALYGYIYNMPEEEMSEDLVELQIVEDVHQEYFCPKVKREYRIKGNNEMIVYSYPAITVAPIGDEFYYVAAVYDPMGEYNLNDAIDHEEYSRVHSYKSRILQAYMEGKTEEEISEDFLGTKTEIYTANGITYVPIYKYGEKNTNKTFVILNMMMKFNFVAKLRKDIDFNFLGADIIDGYVCYMVHKEEIKKEKKHPFRDLKNKIRQWFRKNIKMKFTKKEIKDNLYDDLPF